MSEKILDICGDGSEETLQNVSVEQRVTEICSTMDLLSNPVETPLSPFYDCSCDPESAGENPAGQFAVLWGKISGNIQDQTDLWYYLQKIQELESALGFENGLISPGIVSWTGTGLVFDVSSARYRIEGVLYISPYTQKTLAPADPDDPRIDVIAVDKTSSVVVITGTPSPNPEKPQIDPSTQIELTHIYVPAGATTPNLTEKIIWDENTESVVTSSALVVNPDNVAFSLHGTKSMDVAASTLTIPKLLIMTLPSAFDVLQYNVLTFGIRLKGVAASNMRINVQWRNGNNILSSNVNITNGVYNFNRNAHSVYQIIQIPVSAFTFSSPVINQPATVVDKLVFSIQNASPGMYIDYIRLQNGIPNGPNPQTNSFGTVQTPSGAAVSAIPGDVLTFAAAGGLTISASGKTITFTAASGLPSQTGNSGKFLTTDGTSAFWQTIVTTESDPVFTAWLAGNPLSGYVPVGRTLTINGISYDLSANRSWTISETDPVFSAWLAGNPLSGYVPTSRTLTINGVSYDLSADRSWTISAGVTSVFGRSGAVTAQNGDYNTSQVTESGNLYFTNARAIAAPLTGYTAGAGTVVATDTIIQAIQKLDGNVQFNSVLIGQIQVGNNLFNYYNFI